MITPSQTVGPFFHGGLLREPRSVGGQDGERVHLNGRVLDGDGEPVPDALLELWGRGGYVRAATDEGGRYVAELPRAPYFAVAIFARGLLNHLDTRVYLDERADAVLARVPEHRRPSLIAQRDGDVYRWDVVLQGDAATETVFFRLCSI